MRYLFSALFIIFAFIICSFPIFATDKNVIVCSPVTIPKVVKTLEDWSIVTANETSIATADAFTGAQLTYATDCKAAKQGNVVTIDPRTGIVKVKAEVKDKFDILVSATNACGKATTAFNVEITPEE